MGRGKNNGVKKPHIVVACYIPPSYGTKQSKEFFDVLTDAVLEAMSMSPDSWVTIGGDWNGRPLDELTKLFTDLVIIDSPPTRKTVTLNVVIGNYPQHVVGVSVNHALESEQGTVSDHKILQKSVVYYLGRELSCGKSINTLRPQKRATKS